MWLKKKRVRGKGSEGKQRVDGGCGERRGNKRKERKGRKEYVVWERTGKEKKTR